MSDENLIEVCDAFMTTLNIKRYENKLIKFLSGGNRRKVSLAVALLGAPPTIYLDEVNFIFYLFFHFLYYYFYFYYFYYLFVYFYSHLLV